MVLRYIAIGLLALLCVLGPHPAAAACNESFSAKIALHLTSSTTKIPCGPVQISCQWDSSGIVVSGELEQEYNVYVLLADWESDPFTQIQIGVYYSGGVNVINFQSCASSVTSIGGWPGSGSQLVMSYSSCESTKSDSLFVLGWFRVIAHIPGSLGLTPLLVEPGSTGVCRLIDCDSNEKILSPERIGVVSFGGAGSLGPFDPCSMFIDAYPGPCCLASSCVVNSSLGCCWSQGGTLLDYMSTCAACTLKLLPNTWGRLKSRY